jgi:hypothetical protein
MQKLWVFVLVWIVGCSLHSNAAVIRVEKDGSGDYTVIQDAVDAASDGDVIEIGPGRYDDYTTDPQWGDFRVWLDGDKSLTLRGAGNEQTIIGPETYGNDERDWGVYCYPGSVSIQLYDLRFENLDRSSVVLICDQAFMANCHFEMCNDSFQFIGEGPVYVESCDFINNNVSFPKGLHFTANVVDVSNVSVFGYRVGIKIDGQGTDVEVKNCLVDGMGVGRGGIFLDNVSGVISSCRFLDLTGSGVEVNRPVNVHLIDNIIEDVIGEGQNPGKGIHSYNGGNSLDARGNIISGCEVCFKLQSPSTQFSVTENHFFRADSSEALFVQTNPNWDFYELHVDFTNNYWGTIDPDEISQYIQDGHDFPESTLYIDFLPIANGPVSTDEATLGGIKAMFR